MSLKPEELELMDMKKSTRNLISLSGNYAGNTASEKISENNYLRYGLDE